VNSYVVGTFAAARRAHGYPPLHARSGPDLRWTYAVFSDGDEEISQVPGQPLHACPALRPRQVPDPTTTRSTMGCCLPPC